MHSFISSSRTARFALAFAVFAVVGFSCEVILSILLRGYVPENVRSDAFFVNKVSDVRYPVCIYGDSRTYRGVSPTVISERLGLAAMNLGFSSGGINAEMLQFVDRKLDKTNGRAMIILGISPLALTVRCRANALYHEVQRKASEGWRIETSMPGGILAKVRLLKKKRKEKRAAVVEDFRTDGWCSTWVKDVSRDAIDDGVRRGVRHMDAFCKSTEMARQSMSELISWIRKWRSLGISVYAFRPPTCPETVECENRLGFSESECIAALEAVGAQWIRVEDGKYECYDASHLTREGAEQLTFDLCKDILIKEKERLHVD